MAIQDSQHFELPYEYVYVKQKYDFIQTGLVKDDMKPFDESDIEEIFMLKQYRIAKNKVRELQENVRRNNSKNHH